MALLDAPDLLDDYYLNIMDWGDSNFLAIGLTQTVYLWNAATGDIIELMCVVLVANNRGNLDWVIRLEWLMYC